MEFFLLGISINTAIIVELDLINLRRSISMHKFINGYNYLLKIELINLIVSLLITYIKYFEKIKNIAPNSLRL